MRRPLSKMVVALGFVAAAVAVAAIGDRGGGGGGGGGDRTESDPQPGVLWRSGLGEHEWPTLGAASLDGYPENHTVSSGVPGRDDHVLRVSASADNDGLTGMGIVLRSQFDDIGLLPMEDAVLRYSVYLPPDWRPFAGGKLPGLAGISPPLRPSETPGGGDYSEAGWSGRLMWKPPPPGGDPEELRLHTYLYVRSAAGRDIEGNVNPRNQRMYGISVYFREAPESGRPRDDSKPYLYLRRGEWNTVELRYRMNTPGLPDGIFQGWLNGELGVDLRDVVYRTRSNPALAINQIMFDSFYGGPTANRSDQHWYFGEVSVHRALPR
jgi:hypothetical protein